MTVIIPPSSGHETRRASRVPLLQKIGYAAGGLVDGTTLQSMNIFLLFYVTSVCGLPGGLAGLAIATGLVVDAVADPLIGSSSDRLKSRFGRRLPLMLVALLPVVISFTLIFSIPSQLNQMALFLWLSVFSIGVRLAVALFLLPHQALGAELTDDYGERSTIMALRWSFFMGGGILGVGLGFGIFFSGPNGLTQRAHYMPFALTLGFIALAGGLVACRTALSTRFREHGPSKVDGSALSLFAEVLEVFRSRSFRSLFFGTLLFFVGFGVNILLGLHANTFFWGLSGPQITLVTMALFVGLLLAAPIAGPLLVKVEKRTVIVAGIAGLLFAEAAPVALRLFGLLPLESTTVAMILAAFSLLMGVMAGAAGIAGSSAMADAADEHEHLYGSRREGLYFAGLAFANKAASALGTLIAGVVLQVIGFPVHLAETGGLATVLPKRTVDLLGLAYGPGSAILSLIAISVFWSYAIDRKAHTRVIDALVERRRLGPAR